MAFRAPRPEHRIECHTQLQLRLAVGWHHALQLIARHLRDPFARVHGPSPEVERDEVGHKHQQDLAGDEHFSAVAGHHRRAGHAHLNPAVRAHAVAAAKLAVVVTLADSLTALTRLLYDQGGVARAVHGLHQHGIAAGRRTRDQRRRRGGWSCDGNALIVAVAGRPPCR